MSIKQTLPQAIRQACATPLPMTPDWPLQVALRPGLFARQKPACATQAIEVMRGLAYRNTINRIAYQIHTDPQAAEQYFTLQERPTC